MSKWGSKLNWKSSSGPTEKFAFKKRSRENLAQERNNKVERNPADWGIIVVNCTLDKRLISKT